MSGTVTDIYSRAKQTLEGTEGHDEKSGAPVAGFPHRRDEVGADEGAGVILGSTGPKKKEGDRTCQT